MFKELPSKKAYTLLESAAMAASQSAEALLHLVQDHGTEATLTEFKIALPRVAVHAGQVTFDVQNDGKIPHDLVVQGNGVDAKTPLLDAGQSKTLSVDLKPGTYDLYCSVPGHKEAGMDVKLTVS